MPHSKTLSRRSTVNHDFQSRVGVPPEGVITASQVHGTDVIRIGSAKPAKDEYALTEADAIITDITNVAIGVRTADCLPILLYDPVNAAVAAIHAGWRGSVAGITAKTVRAMGDAFGTKPEDILAALGPHIGACCYTVGIEVISAVKKSGNLADDCLIRENAGTRFDLACFNRSSLINAGVPAPSIDITGHCTFCEKENYYSYRADPTTTGRQISFIEIKEL